MKIVPPNIAGKKSRIFTILQSPRATEHNYYYTKGMEFSLDGENYIGEYHYNNGVPRPGPVRQPGDQRVLRRYYENPDHYNYELLKKFVTPATGYIDPTPYQYKPAPGAYTVGTDVRYFVEKINDDESYAIEIDAEQYSKIGGAGGVDPNIYYRGKIVWRLIGTRETIMSENELALIQASADVPSIQYGVRNYLEFAQITLV